MDKNIKGYKVQELYYLLNKIFEIYKGMYRDKLEISWEELENAIIKCKKWLTEIKNDFKVKNYSDEHIAEQIFSYKRFNKTICRYHIVLIEESILEIEEELIALKNQHIDLTEKVVKGKLNLLRDLIIDVGELLIRCQKEFLGKEINWRVGKRRLIKSNEIYNFSKNILRRYFYFNDISVSPVAIFLIRQAIEVRILNALGIGAIVKDEKVQKFKFEKLIQFIYKHHDKMEFPIKQSILLKIYKWTNPYIHRGIIYYHWEIMFAHKFLKPLFSYGEGKRIISIYGSIKIIMPPYFQTDF